MLVFYYFYMTIIASAHTGDTGIDEYPDISGITTARVSWKVT